MRKISKAELEELERNGARVMRPQAKAPTTVPTALVDKHAVTAIAERQDKMASMLVDVLQALNQTKKKTAYRCTVNRDRRGLIESFDLVPTTK